ncbi:MAG: YbjN domain-containing protein [bacterium]
MTTPMTTASRKTRLWILSLFCAVCLTAVLSADTVQADTEIYTTITGDQLKEIVASEGYTDITVDEDDDLIFKMEGTNVLLLTSSDKESIQFYVAWAGTDANMRGVNDWNKTKKYSRAYIDDDGDPVLELDLDLEGGVTRERIVSFITTFRVSLNAFRDEVL